MIRSVAAAFLLLVVAPLCVAWLTSLRAKPIRWWASHAWEAFGASWLALAVFAMSTAVISVESRRVALVLVVLSATVMTLSAIQGLRLTYRRSRRKALLMVLGFLLFAMLAGHINPAPDVERWQSVLTIVGVALGWVLATALSDFLARWINA